MNLCEREDVSDALVDTILQPEEPVKNRMRGMVDKRAGRDTLMLMCH